MWVLQAQGDVGDVSVHHGGVADAEVAHDDDHVVAHSHVLGHLQLSSQSCNALLGQILVLQTQFTCEIGMRLSVL